MAAGLSTVPTVLLTLLLSRRSGAIADRIGPRLQLVTGPLLCAVGALLALRIDEHASYLHDVLPGVTLFGLGLAVMVAPLTATALDSAPASHAGLASGVNNAVARTASLLAVAAIPVLAGLTGNAFEEPGRFDDGFRAAMWICGALFGVAALVAASGPAESAGRLRHARAGHLVDRVIPPRERTDHDHQG